MRPVGHRAQEWGADVRRDLQQLVDREAGRRRRAGPQHDLDQWLEQARAGEDPGRLVGRARDGGRGHVPLPLREPQECDPRLRRSPQPAGTTVRGLGIGELASEAVELRGLVDRLAK